MLNMTMAESSYSETLNQINYQPISPNITGDKEALMHPYYATYYKTYTFLVITAALIQMVLLYITYKVVRIIKTKNNIILGMLIFMNLNITAKICLYAVNAVEWRNFYNNYDYGDKLPFYFGNGFVAVLVMMPVATFITAILLNLDNWIMMYFKIGIIVDVIQGRAHD